MHKKNDMPTKQKEKDLYINIYLCKKSNKADAKANFKSCTIK